MNRNRLLIRERILNSPHILFQHLWDRSWSLTGLLWFISKTKKYLLFSNIQIPFYLSIFQWIRNHWLRYHKSYSASKLKFNDFSSTSLSLFTQWPSTRSPHDLAQSNAAKKNHAELSLISTKWSENRKPGELWAVGFNQVEPLTVAHFVGTFFTWRDGPVVSTSRLELADVPAGPRVHGSRTYLDGNGDEINFKISFFSFVEITSDFGWICVRLINLVRLIRNEEF